MPARAEQPSSPHRGRILCSVASIRRGDDQGTSYRYVQLERVIVDRGSVFTATLFPVSTVEEVRRHLADLTRSKHYRFASHNVVAYRLRRPDGQLLEHKDDGYSGRGREAGAGRVLLEVLRAKNVVGAVVVVTRWFGGIPLGGARFRHFAAAAAQVVDAARTPGGPG
jgi:putative IMPACT (imprinted ancient) family translation regulator